MHRTYVGVSRNTFDFFTLNYGCIFCSTDSKSNWFEHNKSNCVRSSTWLYCHISVVSAFLFAYQNVWKKIYSWYLKKSDFGKGNMTYSGKYVLFYLLLSKCFERIFYPYLTICSPFGRVWSAINCFWNVTFFWKMYNVSSCLIVSIYIADFLIVVEFIFYLCTCICLHLKYEL